MKKYKEDKGIDILGYADNEMLSVIAKHLIYDKDGKKRNAESLSSNKNFISAGGDYTKCWKEIATELQHFGGDSIANSIRGTGVAYREILIDVCKRLKVKTDYGAEIIKIEQAMFAQLIKKSWEKMSVEERVELQKNLKIDPKLVGPTALATIITAINMGGFASYQIAVIVANSVAKMIMGKGLQVVANAGLTRAIGVLAGPIGWVITLVLTVPSITGPAFRVTLPAVIQVATIRQQLENKDLF